MFVPIRIVWNLFKMVFIVGLLWGFVTGPFHSAPATIQDPNATYVDRSTSRSVDIPSDYYSVHVNWPDHSERGLEELVGHGFYQEYKANEFDCSNMAAYLEWDLRRYGFDARICRSLNFGPNNDGHHSWVRVIIGNTRYYIESTSHTKLIYTPSDNDYKYYDDREATVYTNIYDVAGSGLFNDYKWWNTLNYTQMKNMRR